MRAEKTALIIIDMQNDFASEKGYKSLNGLDLSVVRKTVPVIQSLAQTIRQAGGKVIHVKTEHDRNTDSEVWVSRSLNTISNPKVCVPGTWGAEIIDELKPREGEPVVIKHRYDAFIGTDLQLILNVFETKNLLICGTATNVCVDSTARRAFLMDYQTVLVEDAVSTTSHALHAPTLANFDQNFGYVVWSNQIAGLLI